MHFQGDLEGQGPVWGYVKGGMGVISFAIAEAAEEAGAVLACGVPVAEIIPGEGVRLESGDLIRATTVVCNADPKRALGMLGVSEAVPEPYRARLEAWQVRSPVVKFNAALSRLPTFTAAAGEQWPYHSMVSVTHGLDAAQTAFADCAAGRVNIGFGEVYFQTGYDATPARE
jgi:phytoene dehydrogenase-like protein